MSGPDAAPSASEPSKGEDTTALFPSICRGGAVPGHGADDAIDFDKYRIAGWSAWGRSAGGSVHSKSGHGGATTMRDAVPRDFDSVYRNNNRSRITPEGSAVWGRQEGGVW